MYEGYPLPFVNGKLYLYRDFCDFVPVNELIKFPFPLYSARGLKIVDKITSHQDNYFIILLSESNSLRTYIRYFDPNPITIEVNDTFERQSYMLNMQSIVDNDPNYILNNNLNDGNQLEGRIEMGTLYLRRKIFYSFDIEWKSKGQIFGEILNEADAIVKNIENETISRLGFTE
ncbi:MAG: hypothetical protein U5K00_00950 [Melioribacteraceae bacterium]|nr:hypothetical protein [Melioribacteraceae bacterium]